MISILLPLVVLPNPTTHPSPEALGLSAYIRKEEKLQGSKLSFHLKKLEKDQQNKLKASKENNKGKSRYQ